MNGEDVRDGFVDAVTLVNNDNIAIAAKQTAHDAKFIELTEGEANAIASANIAADYEVVATEQAVIATTKANEASASKTAAQTAQTAAETAKTASEAAKTAAQLAETNAKTSETNSKASETAADASKVSAAGSAATATTKAGESAASAAAALASEQAAAEHEATTLGYKDATIAAVGGATDLAEIIESRKGKATLGEKISEIAANAITASKIKAGEITTDHVASNFGETLDISSNSSISLQITQQDIDDATDDIKNNIVSYINLSSESADIYADKINLTGYCTFTTAQSLADSAESDATTAGYNYAMGVKNGLGTSGYTTINGSNITTGVLNANLITTGTMSASRINLTGALNGYSSGNTTGFSINSSGVITIPYSAPLNWDSGSSIRGNLQSNGGFSIDASSSDISLNCGSSYHSKIYNMQATSQPYNIPMTTTSSTTKITEIAHFSTYLNVTCNDSNYGVYYTVSDKRLKTNIKPSKINALDRLISTKIRDFNWIKDGSNVDCGVIAQEVEQDVGERYVLKVPQPNGGVNYQVNSYEFMPLIVKGIQELNEKHEEKTAQLTNEIAILKQICEQQQQQINELKALIA